MALRRWPGSLLRIGLGWMVMLASLWWVEGLAHAASDSTLAFAVEGGQVPSRLCPGELRRVALDLRNTGSAAWDPELGDRVAYHWIDERGTMVVRDGERSELPHAIASGESLKLSARLLAPDRPGRYRLQWALVREQVRWVESGDRGPEIEVVGEGPALAWARVSGGEALELRAEQETTVVLGIRNEGCATWDRARGDRLTYRWYDRDGRVVVVEGERSPLPELAPGEVSEIRARVQAPPHSGRFALQWQPVREGLAWFPDTDPLVFVEVGVSPWAWSLHVLDPIDALGAGAEHELRVWLVNEGESEWSRSGGDALSYRWYDEAGNGVAEGPRTRLPSPWLPGDAEVLLAKVVAPIEPGAYRLVWEPVREGVRWLGSASAPGASMPIEITAPALSWAIESIDHPGARWARRTDPLRVVLRNTGAEAWSPEQGDRLSYRWYDEAGDSLLGDGLRTPLPGEVAPGQTVTLWARIRGPDEPGRFVLGLEMVREHVRWYGPPTAGQARVVVRVERWSSYWVALLGVAGLLTVFVLRRAEGSPSRVHWWLWRCGPALWIGAGVAALVHCFVDLSGAEPWSGAQLIVLGPAAWLAFVLLPLPPRVQAWSGALVLGLLTLVALADLAYLHFFGSIVPLAAVLAVHHLGDAGATVSSLLRPAYGWLLALPLLALAVAWLWPRRECGRRPARKRTSLVALGLVLALAGGPFVVAIARAFASGLSQRVFSEQDNVGRLGIVGAHLFQLLRELDTWLGPQELSASERERLRSALAEHHATREEVHERAPGFGAARGYDVVLIQVEALQDWVIGTHVQGQAITPFLDAARDGALYFDQVFDQTAQGRTSDAEYLVLGAGHPPSSGALAFVHEDNAFHTLAHVLADAGYATTSAHPYKRGFWNRARLHPRYGFEDSWFRRELGPGPTIGWGLSDAAFFERMLPQMVTAPRPSLTFLVTLSLHHPYERFPAALEELDLGSLQGQPVGNYLHAMHHFDGALAELMAALDREGRAERTLVIVYGDHVTGLGETPEVLALAGRPTWDPAAHLELHRVPVFIWVGSAAPESLRGPRSRVGGHVDIGPTVLHLLGIEDPRTAALGQPLLDPAPGFAVISNGGAIDAELMFVARGEGIPRGGACFERGGGRSVPRERCVALADRGAHELEVARLVLEHDLHRSEIGAQ